MAYTIADARQVVLENLDDETGARYARTPATNTSSYTKIDRALRGALTSVLDEYNGDRFDEQITATTSATTGLVDLSSSTIAKIKDVRVDTGVSTYRITEGDIAAGGRPDYVARNLKLTVVKVFAIANPVVDDTQLLVGATAGAARSWDAFDELVCARAADALGAKDDEKRQAILRSIERLERAVRAQKHTPMSKPWPELRPDSLTYAGRLRWVWQAKAQTLALLHSDAVIG